MLLITVLYILIGIRLQRSSQVARRGLPESQSCRYLVRGSQRGYAHTRSTRRVVKMLGKFTLLHLLLQFTFLNYNINEYQ